MSVFIVEETVAILILLELTLQSEEDCEITVDGIVAILILLELTLQCGGTVPSVLLLMSRNPYFIGINSAI